MPHPRIRPANHSPSLIAIVLAYLAFLLLCLAFAQRPRPASTPSAARSAPAVRTNTAAAVVAGLTRVDPAAYNGWGGDCPGSDVDAETFALMCEGEGVPFALLRNTGATRAGVLDAARGMVTTLAPDGLLILYFSGHGGQKRQAVSGSEPDGQDETICLWDGQLRDDDVWAMLKRLPEGMRVWMITDSCNSGTNYRGVHDYAGGIAAAAAREGRGESAVSLLHWGGCGDGESSYGSPQGGHFTTALVDAWRRGQSYAEWFEAARRLTPRAQVPTCTALGAAVEWRHRPAFR